jgi:hypothetical protein
MAQRYDDRRIQSFSYDGKAFSVLLLELGTHTNNLIATDKVYQEIESSLVWSLTMRNIDDLEQSFRSNLQDSTHDHGTNTTLFH